jgi:protein LTV1
MVFQELAPSQAPKVASKARNRADLETDLFSESGDFALRDNEGEAAEHGIYYDDTDYDYMQHMRDLGGNGGTESVWVEAPSKEKGKGKEKQSLEVALREMDIDGKAKLTDETILPSKDLRKTTYQDQQDIPDALAGFQPDMDPRLREALEALEDDAYVEDDNDESFFGEIAEGGEVSLNEFEELGYDPEGGFEDDGWSTDDTAKPTQEYKEDVTTQNRELRLPDADEAPPDAAEHGDGDFMATFRNLPKSARAAAPSRGGPGSIMTGTSAFTAGGRKKKRKGAMTNSDAYSMTSSSLFRTEGLTTLDARFEKTLETYAEDDEEGFADDDTSSVVTGMSNVSGISGVSGISRASGVSRASSQAPDLVMRKDFDDIMDEFLGTHSMQGKKRVKKGKQTGIEQLDEIRRELGKPVGKSVKAGR